MPLPEGTLLTPLIAQGDFTDCFGVTTQRPLREAAELAVNFPAWVRTLLALRNVLVTPLGLRASLPAVRTLGPFPLLDERPGQLLLGGDDRHLDFRLSAVKRGSTFTLATWVRCHNTGGRAYLAAILPFHKVIVRNAVARAGE